jgi:HPt (histidine-containing phosphotransfer) domain-containing protein
MTANTMQGDREACLAAGMDDYVGKPIRVGELQEALERTGAWLREREGAVSPAEPAGQPSDLVAVGVAEPPKSNGSGGVAEAAQPIGDGAVADPTASDGNGAATLPDPIDRSILDSLKELQVPGEPDLVAEFVRLYHDETPPLLSALRDGVSGGDADAIRRAAHTLKSSSANLGANHMSALAAELERKGRSGELEGIAALLADLEREADRVSQALEAV